MKALTYLSDCGMIVQFSNQFPFIVSYADLNSAGAVFDEIQPVGMDGAYTQGASYSKKIIPIEGTIVGNSQQDIEQYRSLLSMAMNVRVCGTLIADLYNGKKKKIRCRPNQAPSYAKTFGLGQAFSCDFQCDNPYWLDYEETIVPIGQIIPQWRFPFTPPVTFGYAVANVDILNDTSIEIPLRIEVVSQTTLIEINNISTGESFGVSALIDRNHKMVIDGTACEISIINMLTGAVENATNKLIAGSNFITLQSGRNQIELNKGIADATPLSYIIYNQHSLGV